ncbi:cell division protein ZapA [Thalassotalea sp. G2M2-11]|uniref:cell division protein ZapA n=1 Tax=Thalassotalea sp. G2M2-11 TaxID=2787627 RepID=UPI0019D202FA|nr:cell division protein ZapA [Thalassotalea sp. G2M2-11]
MNQHNVTIEVANRRLKVACPQGQESALLQAAEEVNQRLNNDKQKGQSLKTPEQTMLMTALNLANDYLTQQRKFEQEKKALHSQIDLLQQTIEQAVKQPKKKA